MIKHIYLFLSLFTYSTSFCQIAASTLTGCVPVAVTFTGVVGATNPLWNFNDGATSPNNNPTHVFTTIGTHIVTYTATGISQQSLTITVHGKPTPRFRPTTSIEGCIPLTVSFKDSSSGGGNSLIQTWQWVFGDGGTTSGIPSTVTYTYVVAGEFDVSVKVTDANGCDSSLVKNNLVIVSQKPTMSLVTNPNPASACVPPLTVTFTAVGSISHSPLGAALTYSWNFGGGVTSTSATPTPQTYTASGAYPIYLQVTDANNCSNYTTTTVSIQSPTATFTSPNDTLCINVSTTFNSAGSTVGTQLWNYGDGTTGPIGTHTYTAPGHYYVLLKVTNGACSDTIGLSVFVQKPVANFSVTPTYMCSLPKTISLTNSSTPTSGTTYQWHYFQHYTQYSINPLTSNSVSSTFTITHLDTNRYAINTLNMMDSISLVITTAQGCISHKSFILIDTIYLPTARFITSFYQGCVPLTVNFADSSRVGPREHITSWKYIFGDGANTTIASAPGNSTHTYTNTGIYYPKLVIQTQDGCIDTSFAIKIEVGTPPNASFNATPTPICIGNTVHFTNTTPASDSVDSWHYYGDGNYYVSSCTDNASPSWPFTHATGVQSTSLVACFRGCCDSVSGPSITVNGPLATFSAAMDCDSSFVYNFTGNISNFPTNATWTWNFGDGDTTAVFTSPNSQNIAHTYTASGDYNVILSSYNASTGCSPSRDTIKIHVRDIKSDFTYDTLICSAISYTFNSANSSNVYTYGNNGYIWLWGDGAHPDITSNTLISHSFAGHGGYTVSLITKDINGCPDTTKKVVKAFSVNAAFIPSQDTMCKNSTITFSNTSTADTTFTHYSWNFGDGTPLDTLKNPSHTYTVGVGINTISVILSATTALGCTATIQENIVVSRPNASFTTSSLNICSGDSIHFNCPKSYPNITWAYGDGTSLGPTPPITNNWHHYNASGAYTTTLTVIDKFGCTDSETNTQTINVQNIPVVVILSPAFGNNLCYPTDTAFTDNSVANVFLSRVWNTHNGTTYNNNLSTITPSPPYNAPGTYTISLTETTTFGCTSTLTRTFVINGPVADFTISKDTICKGQSITFNIKDTSDVFKWYWDFGDGEGGDTLSSPVTHTYNFHPPNANGTTNVILVYYSPGLACKEAKVYSVTIYQVIADFIRNGNDALKIDTAHCLGTPDVFTNTSTGSLATNNWSFGDGSTSILASPPPHTYMVAGTYTVELIIKTSAASGCVDTMKKQMVIYPLFTNETVNGDTICKGIQTATLTASGNGVTYTWTSSAGLSATNISNPTATPSVSTTYTLYASDVNGCKDSVTSFIFVQQPPVIISWDTTIVIGQTVTLPGGQAPGYSFTWTPTNNLSCTNCSTPVYNGTVNATFAETISDHRGCFNAQSTFTVDVLPEASIAVPTAFTPNGDGTNDVVFVAGWGIKSLQYFKIFNRWGELIFESTDIKMGWDGTYKGVSQNIETYVYEASALSYISDKPLTKKGYIKLLR